jgi:thiol-disulfide isomerase/thioredoxin
MNWLNVDQPLTLQSLRGKVVLVDFFTYSCINCIRTLPYLTSWYEKYRDQGLVVVGVHTPEFEFEKKTSNVADALKKYNIAYPVAQDNDFGTWQAYHNQYWPAHYLIDATGNIREYHFGEGNYVETEKAIQELLGEAGQRVASDTLSLATDTPGSKQTPETYLGSARMERFVSPEQVANSEQAYTLPERMPLDSFAFGGLWNVEKERALPFKGARLGLHFQGKKVFLVMAPAQAGQISQVQVLLDGKSIAAEVAGADVVSGKVAVSEDRLYEVVDLRGQTSEHTLELQFENGDTAVYAFTFS